MSTAASPAAPEGRPARPLLGVLLTVAGGVSLAGMDAVGKHLTGELPVLQVIWARYFVHAVLVAGGLAVLDPRLGFLRSRRPGLQLLRAACLLSATLMMYTALTRIPLADATAVQFFAPVLVTLLAAAVLRERVDAVRLGAVAAGFAGVLLIVRPGVSSDPYLLLPVGSAATVACYLLLTRILAGSDDARATLFNTTALGAAALSLAVPAAWSAPSPGQWGWMLALGALGAVGHLCWVLAMRCAPASLLSPFLYAQLLAAALLSVVVFGDPVTVWLVAGGAVVVASGLVVTMAGRRG
jgi:drug/metabolite transporter (DMT)-like permease